MRTSLTYALVGFFFFLVVILLNVYVLDVYVPLDYVELFVGVFAAGVATAVGLLKGARAGLAFGLVSILAFLAFSVATNYPSYLSSLQADPVDFSVSLLPSIVSYVLLGFIFAVFGALPAYFYLRSEKTGSLAKALLGAALLSTLILIGYNALLTYIANNAYTMDDLMVGLWGSLFWFIGAFVWSGICAALSVRSLNAKAPFAQPHIPAPMTDASSTYDAETASSDGTGLRCPSCGMDNVATADFCSRCGARLRDDETRIY